MDKKAAMHLAERYGHQFVYTVNGKNWRLASFLGQISNYATDGYLRRGSKWVRFNKVSW